MAMATKRSPLVMFFQARIEYLECVHQGTRDTMPEKLATDSTNSLMKQLAFARTITMQDAIDLTKMVNESKLPEDSAACVRQAIQDKADITGDVANSTQSPVKQNCLFIETYQSAEDWEYYGSQQNSHNAKMLRMVQRMNSILLHHPTEPTIAGAVTVALYSDGPHEANYLLQSVRAMKEMLQAMVKDSVKPASYPETYPADVKQFNDEHPVVYASAFCKSPPAACPIQAVVLQVMKSSTPCRKSNTGCTAVVLQDPRHLARSQRMVQSTLCRQPSHIALPGFQWCGRGLEAVRESARPLALEWPLPGVFAAPPAIAPPALLAIADRCTQPQSEGNGPQDMLPKPAVPVESQRSSSSLASSEPAQPVENNEAVEPSIAPVSAKGTAALSDLVARFHQKAAEAKDTAAKATSEEVEIRTPMKRPAAAMAPTKSTPSGKKKKKAKVKAKVTAKVAAGKGPFNEDALKYRSGPSKPRYYGCVTIYTDNVQNLWRVKPRPGERLDRKFKMKEGDDNRKQWSALVAHVKSLPQV